MTFQCIFRIGRKMEQWLGNVAGYKKNGDCYEIKIQSRSSITVIFGKTSQGAFACMPDFGAGCHLVSLKDKFWNTEKLTSVLGKVDGVTVATALYELSDKIEL